MLKEKLNCILLIDDDEPTNFFNRMIVDNAACAKEILVEQSASDALYYLNQQPKRGEVYEGPQPELIFLDINMPAMDGWEFMEKFALLPPAIQAASKVIMLTTSYNPEDEKKARRISAVTDFIKKPFSEEKLTVILRKYFADRF